MNKYFETQANTKEYEKTINGVINRLDYVREEIVKTDDTDQKKELSSAVISGYMSVIDSMETMFGAGSCKGLRDDTASLQKLRDSEDYDGLVSSASKLSGKCMIHVSSGCHRIMCEAAAKVPEAEINAEIQEVLNILGNDIVLSHGYDADYPEEADYMRRHNKIYVFPYNYTERYDASKVRVFKDETCGLKYVEHHGKKLFFPEWNDEEVQREYNQLILEQDMESPHQYFDDRCCLNDGDIFVDVGTAEGIIALDAVDRAAEVYLIECSDNWIRTLKETFKDHMDKVHIIPKYAGASDDDTTITIDTLLNEYRDRDIFIKMDIEGMEPDALIGAQKTLERNNCHVSCAVYHTNDERDEVMDFFERNGYSSYTSDHYMLFLYCRSLFENGKYERIRPPYFRNGVVRAVRR